MTADPYRKPGFYWVRFMGEPCIAEYTSDGHWLMPRSARCYSDDDCEPLSDRLEEPGAPGDVKAAGVSPSDVAAGKLKVIDYLIGVAGKTQGAEVWRALLAEMRQNVLERAK